MLEPTARSARRAPTADGGHAADLLAQVYDQLRRHARRVMAGELEPATLQPTALVHETYLRLCAEHERGWASRAQFFRAAATAMRRILVEAARRRRALRHGGAMARVALDEHACDRERPPDLLELDVALEQLAAVDRDLFELVELRYFAGLTVDETASVLGASPRTVRRDWETARLFLYERVLAARGSA